VETARSEEDTTQLLARLFARTGTETNREALRRAKGRAGIGWGSIRELENFAERTLIFGHVLKVSKGLHGGPKLALELHDECRLLESYGHKAERDLI